MKASNTENVPTLPSKTATSIQVIDRLIALLDAMATDSDPLSLKRLAEKTELHPSTAFRILAALVSHGLVERTESGHYRLGVKLLQLGSQVRGRVDLRREAEPVLRWLCDELNETVNLIVREGDEIVYVDRATPHRMMRVEQAIGGHLPLHVAAVGKLFLGEGGAEACLDYAERTGLPGRTEHSIRDSGALWREIKEVLAAGVAYDNQEAELGVGCIGVAVRDSTGEMVAGISVSAPIHRRNANWVPVLRQAGTRLSSRLGYIGKP